MNRRTRADRNRRNAERDARRESLLVLLSRAQRRGTLTATEAGPLRAHVEAEIDEANCYRAEASGQQAAVRREQQRTRAAEQAVREAEQHAADAWKQLAAVRAALPSEPRPRFGLPNTLAYEDGRHDMADAVRDALAQH
ncbi:MAG: hypothetical protein HOY79_06045 [Streptomyces sp.]|nr:hypothetical protein [Streptomyces sp.]